MPSEKWAVGRGSDDDAMRMITASFVRAIERFAGDLCLHFLPLFQKVVAIKKTCNQLVGFCTVAAWDPKRVICCVGDTSRLHEISEQALQHGRSRTPGSPLAALAHHTR